MSNLKAYLVLGLILIAATMIVVAVSAEDPLVLIERLFNITSNHEARITALELKLNMTPPVDPCVGVVCQDTIRFCDGSQQTCPNTCSQGKCSQCVPPQCPIVDKCLGVICQNTTVTCYDNSKRTCANTCTNGVCSQCTPTACLVPPVTKKVVILQMDDLQAWWLESTAIKVVNLTIKKNVPITLGVIPEALLERNNQKGSITEALKLWFAQNKNTVEIAEHTYDHTDYSGKTLQWQVDDLNKGKAIFAQLGITVNTFIPAYNWGNQYTLLAVKQTGFGVAMDMASNPLASTKPEGLVLLDNSIMYGGEFGSWDYATINPKIQAMLKAKNYCVVGFHQQDFTSQTIINKFGVFLDDLVSKGNYTIMTASQYAATLQ